MSSHDLIFSNRFSYRVSRHLLFWLVCVLISYVSSWLPNYSVVIGPFYSDWNVEELLKRVDKNGGWVASLTVQFFNSWYKVLLGQIVFTYFILFFTVPGYLSEKKNKTFVTIITLIFMAIHFIYQYSLFYSQYAGAVRRGDRPYMPDRGYIIAATARGYFANTLTIVVSLAVTIKLLKRWWRKQMETEQLGREKAKAELQLLKAQIHPHFLFNTLNNIYYFTLSASKKAPGMIKKLSDMLHYILNECDQPLVPVEKELKMIQDYFVLEKIRYGEEVDMTLDIKGDYHNKMMTPLLLIPFIENSFKHGASKMLTHPYVKLNISIEDNNLLLLLRNNKPEVPMLSKNGGLGLKNVRKRLQLLYPGTHELNIVNEPESFIVFLKVRLQVMIPQVISPEKKEIERYAIA